MKDIADKLVFLGIQGVLTSDPTFEFVYEHLHKLDKISIRRANFVTENADIVIIDAVDPRKSKEVKDMLRDAGLRFNSLFACEKGGYSGDLNLWIDTFIKRLEVGGNYENTYLITHNPNGQEIKPFTKINVIIVNSSEGLKGATPMTTRGRVRPPIRTFKESNLSRIDGDVFTIKLDKEYTPNLLSDDKYECLESEHGYLIRGLLGFL